MLGLGVLGMEPVSSQGNNYYYVWWYSRGGTFEEQLPSRLRKDEKQEDEVLSNEKRDSDRLGELLLFYGTMVPHAAQKPPDFRGGSYFVGVFDVGSLVQAQLTTYEVLELLVVNALVQPQHGRRTLGFRVLRSLLRSPLL